MEQDKNIQKGVEIYTPKVGDYVVGKKPYGFRYRNGEEVRIYKIVYGTITNEYGNDLWIQTKRHSYLLENFETVRLATKKVTETRWQREPKIEATFILTQSLPWSLSLAKKFNKQFCKDFDLVRSKIKIKTFRKNASLIGLHNYDRKIISLSDRLQGAKMWETFFHELAHYREQGHSKSFHEEMKMIYVRFERWCNEKSMLIAADKEKK